MLWIKSFLCLDLPTKLATFRVVVMLLILGGPGFQNYVKPFLSKILGGAQTYFYYSLSQKLGGPGPPWPVVRLRPWIIINLNLFFLADLLQIDIEESYRHLSYKTLSGFRWIVPQSQNVNWIIKTDDDISVDWDKLMISLDRSQTKAWRLEFLIIESAQL